ncbi:hypothetical protein R3P38DRAFT_3619294 [Favolaschia claudopus]|uniref:SHSP domain-containing protein n=1 Tax=Favolaschia claudopus TaxID=2862362 RepID=A0AAW0DC67_9AGAR
MPGWLVILLATARLAFFVWPTFIEVNKQGLQLLQMQLFALVSGEQRCFFPFNGQPQYYSLWLLVQGVVIASRFLPAASENSDPWILVGYLVGSVALSLGVDAIFATLAKFFLLSQKPKPLANFPVQTCRFLTTTTYYDPSSHVERLFNDAFGRASPSNTSTNNRRRIGDGNDDGQRTIRPRMDLHEDAASNTVTATFELPGIKKEDVQIDVHNGRVLTLSGNANSGESPAHSSCLRASRVHQESEVKAAMDNGVLTVTFLRSTPEAPKEITIAQK